VKAFSKEAFVNSRDGIDIYYEREGQGRGLLLCDGLLCQGHIWKYFVSALANKWECIHWHYPGHGRSDDPLVGSSLSPERLADDAACVLRAVGGKTVTAIGHSMGGQVAFELWHRHRDLVNGLVIICGSPGKIVEGFYDSAVLGGFLPVFDLFSKVIPEPMRKLWKRLPVDLLSKVAHYSRGVNPRLIRPADLGEYLSRLNRVDLKVAIRMLEDAGAHDATSYLNEIDVPVLVIAGKEDTFTLPERSELMASLIPNSELVMVSGGTHSLPIEQPDLVNLRVMRFLQEQVGL